MGFDVFVARFQNLCLIAEEQRSHLPADFDDFEDPVVEASGAELQEVIEPA